ncbi:hypothetical protein KIL84_008136 [Mauremys mutica]|uniref:RING-type domain-containing protein n=1 Tax=Mauremys mutica TaxID=74926 RepID=A0A9D3WPI2_9SAUR|nr:hypothetical protein KIL84_008136 [Mauremys mutica]
MQMFGARVFAYCTSQYKSSSALGSNTTFGHCLFLFQHLYSKVSEREKKAYLQICNSAVELKVMHNLQLVKRTQKRKFQTTMLIFKVLPTDEVLENIINIDKDLIENLSKSKKPKLDLVFEEWDVAGLPWWFLGNLRNNYKSRSNWSTDIQTNQDIDTAIVSDTTDDLWFLNESASDQFNVAVKVETVDCEEVGKESDKKVIEVTCTDDLEDSQSLSDDTDVEAASEVVLKATFSFSSPKPVFTMCKASCAMAARSQVKHLQESVICSICLASFNDPVILIKCGHNFCRSCITQYCTESETSPWYLCPQCREPFREGEFQANRELRNVVEIAKNIPEPRGKKVCEKHEELLKLFCEVDQTLICLVFRESHSNKDHSLLPSPDML